MNTITDNGRNLAVAENYYHQMLQKNFGAMEKCLHPDVHFIGPLAEMYGKEAVVLAAKNLSQVLRDIKIRSKFAYQNQVMFAYDFMFTEPIGELRAAVLMTFTEQIISKIELFFDGRPFEEKKIEPRLCWKCLQNKCDVFESWFTYRNKFLKTLRCRVVFYEAQYLMGSLKG